MNVPPPTPLHMMASLAVSQQEYDSLVDSVVRASQSGEHQVTTSKSPEFLARLRAETEEHVLKTLGGCKSKQEFFAKIHKLIRKLESSSSDHERTSYCNWFQSNRERLSAVAARLNGKGFADQERMLAVLNLLLPLPIESLAQHLDNIKFLKSAIAQFQEQLKKNASEAQSEADTFMQYTTLLSKSHSLLSDYIDTISIADPTPIQELLKEVISKSEKVSAERFKSDYLLFSVHSHIKSLAPTMNSLVGTSRQLEELLHVTFFIIHEWQMREQNRLRRSTGTVVSTEASLGPQYKKMKTSLCAPTGIQDTKRYAGMILLPAQQEI